MHVKGLLEDANGRYLIYHFTVFTAAEASRMERMVGADRGEALVNQAHGHLLPGTCEGFDKERGVAAGHCG